MPEKSGTDAALCAPYLADAAAGATCCAEAGMTAAANVTSTSKCRCAFMSISPSWFARGARLLPVRAARRLLEMPQIRRLLSLLRGHEKAVRAHHVILFADGDMVVGFGTVL